MYTLRCDNLNETIRSLSYAFGVTGMDIRRAFGGICQYDYASMEIPPFQFFQDEIVRLLGRPRLPCAVRWFHFSSVFNLNVFKEGLKPIEDVLERTLHDVTLRIPKRYRTKFAQLRFPDALPDNVRCRFSQPPEEKGPHAMLVKDAARYCKVIMARDYLEKSELMEGVLTAASSHLDVDLFKIIENKLKPVVVCFESSRDIYEDLIYTAFLYAYKKRLYNTMSLLASTCYHSDGRKIEWDDICYVKEYRPNRVDVGR